MEEGEGDGVKEGEKMEGLDLELPSFSEDKLTANLPPKKGGTLPMQLLVLQASPHTQGGGSCWMIPVPPKVFLHGV